MREQYPGKGAMSMNISRRPVALVTGGSRGIGAAAALALANRGYDVAITYRNKAARANEVAGEIAKLGVRSLALQSDITLQADRERIFSELSAWSERLDALILNASGGWNAICWPPSLTTPCISIVMRRARW